MSRVAACLLVIADAACTDGPTGRRTVAEDLRACLEALDAGTPAGEPCDWTGSCSDEHLICEPGERWGSSDYDCVDGRVVVVRSRCPFDGGGG